MRRVSFNQNLHSSPGARAQTAAAAARPGEADGDLFGEAILHRPGTSSTFPIANAGPPPTGYKKQHAVVEDRSKSRSGLEERTRFSDELSKHVSRIQPIEQPSASFWSSIKNVEQQQENKKALDHLKRVQNVLEKYEFSEFLDAQTAHRRRLEDAAIIDGDWTALVTEEAAAASVGLSAGAIAAGNNGFSSFQGISKEPIARASSPSRASPSPPPQPISSSPIPFNPSSSVFNPIGSSSSPPSASSPSPSPSHSSPSPLPRLKSLKTLKSFKIRDSPNASLAATVEALTGSSNQMHPVVQFALSPRSKQLVYRKEMIETVARDRADDMLKTKQGIDKLVDEHERLDGNREEAMRHLSAFFMYHDPESRYHDEFIEELQELDHEVNADDDESPQDPSSAQSLLKRASVGSKELAAANKVQKYRISNLLDHLNALHSQLLQFSPERVREFSEHVRRAERECSELRESLSASSDKLREAERGNWMLKKSVEARSEQIKQLKNEMEQEKKRFAEILRGSESDMASRAAAAAAAAARAAMSGIGPSSDPFMSGGSTDLVQVFTRQMQMEQQLAELKDSTIQSQKRTMMAESEAMREMQHAEEMKSQRDEAMARYESLKSRLDTPGGVKPILVDPSTFRNYERYVSNLFAKFALKEQAVVQSERNQMAMHDQLQQTRMIAQGLAKQVADLKKQLSSPQLAPAAAAPSAPSIAAAAAAPSAPSIAAAAAASVEPDTYQHQEQEDDNLYEYEEEQEEEAEEAEVVDNLFDGEEQQEQLYDADEVNDEQAHADNVQQLQPEEGESSSSSIPSSASVRSQSPPKPKVDMPSVSISPSLPPSDLSSGTAPPSPWSSSNSNQPAPAQQQQQITRAPSLPSKKPVRPVAASKSVSKTSSDPASVSVPSTIDNSSLLDQIRRLQQRLLKTETAESELRTLKETMKVESEAHKAAMDAARLEARELRDAMEALRREANMSKEMVDQVKKSLAEDEQQLKELKEKLEFASATPASAASPVPISEPHEAEPEPESDPISGIDGHSLIQKQNQTKRISSASAAAGDSVRVLELEQQITDLLRQLSDDKNASAQHAESFQHSILQSASNQKDTLQRISVAEEKIVQLESERDRLSLELQRAKQSLQTAQAAAAAAPAASRAPAGPSSNNPSSSSSSSNVVMVSLSHSSSHSHQIVHTKSSANDPELKAALARDLAGLEDIRQQLASSVNQSNSNSGIAAAALRAASPPSSLYRLPIGADALLPIQAVSVVMRPAPGSPHQESKPRRVPQQKTSPDGSRQSSPMRNASPPSTIVTSASSSSAAAAAAQAQPIPAASSSSSQQTLMAAASLQPQQSHSRSASPSSTPFTPVEPVQAVAAPVVVKPTPSNAPADRYFAPITPAAVIASASAAAAALQPVVSQAIPILDRYSPLPMPVSLNNNSNNSHAVTQYSSVLDFHQQQQPVAISSSIINQFQPQYVPVYSNPNSLQSTPDMDSLSSTGSLLEIHGESMQQQQQQQQLKPASLDGAIRRLHHILHQFLEPLKRGAAPILLSTPLYPSSSSGPFPLLSSASSFAASPATAAAFAAGIIQPSSFRVPPEIAMASPPEMLRFDTEHLVELLGRFRDLAHRGELFGERFIPEITKLRSQNATLDSQLSGAQTEAKELSIKLQEALDALKKERRPRTPPELQQYIQPYAASSSLDETTKQQTMMSLHHHHHHHHHVPPPAMSIVVDQETRAQLRKLLQRDAELRKARAQANFGRISAAARFEKSQIELKKTLLVAAPRDDGTVVSKALIRMAETYRKSVEKWESRKAEILAEKQALYTNLFRIVEDLALPFQPTLSALEASQSLLPLSFAPSAGFAGPSAVPAAAGADMSSSPLPPLSASLVPSSVSPPAPAPQALLLQQEVSAKGEPLLNIVALPNPSPLQLTASLSSSASASASSLSSLAVANANKPDPLPSASSYLSSSSSSAAALQHDSLFVSGESLVCDNEQQSHQHQQQQQQSISLLSPSVHMFKPPPTASNSNGGAGGGRSISSIGFVGYRPSPSSSLSSTQPMMSVVLPQARSSLGGMPSSPLSSQQQQQQQLQQQQQAPSTSVMGGAVASSSPSANDSPSSPSPLQPVASSPYTRKIKNSDSLLVGGPKALGSIREQQQHQLQAAAVLSSLNVPTSAPGSAPPAPLPSSAHLLNLVAPAASAGGGLASAASLFPCNSLVAPASPSFAVNGTAPSNSNSAPSYGVYRTPSPSKPYPRLPIPMPSPSSSIIHPVSTAPLGLGVLPPAAAAAAASGPVPLSSSSSVALNAAQLMMERAGTSIGMPMAYPRPSTVLSPSSSSSSSSSSSFPASSASPSSSGTFFPPIIRERSNSMGSNSSSPKHAAF